MGSNYAFIRAQFEPKQKHTTLPQKGTAMKKGILISPLFPDGLYWGMKHALNMLGKNITAYPPLGALTFAALMPQDEWEFQLIDFNVKKPTNAEMKKIIESADAVFISAMNVQRESIIHLLKEPAYGTSTPIVLGGPMASTYRDIILEPETKDDQILHNGIDFLAWGEAAPWIKLLCEALDRNPVHSATKPHLFIPQRVLDEPSGSRKYLRDQEIFKPLSNIPVPRWDLIDRKNYRSMMMQTTAGCRFRCNFCDIVQFNGGFARAKDKTTVKQELQAIYNTGFTGMVFTVDDNFVSDPEAMEAILEVMIEFQRQHNYPFKFITQASVDLGKDDFAHLIELMVQAGFKGVFLGVENPDPAALKEMGKIQNLKTKPEKTVRKLQKKGIEVFAGFIYGSDADTKHTAQGIVDFSKKSKIFNSMTGKLSPMPHTPLYVEMKNQGRLIKVDAFGNNVASNLGFKPKMGEADFQEGYLHIIRSLFDMDPIYERAKSVVSGVDTNIFDKGRIRYGELRAAVISMYKQGRTKGLRFDPRYWSLIKEGISEDNRMKIWALDELGSLKNILQLINEPKSGSISLDEYLSAQFERMINPARQAFIRFDLAQELDQIAEFFSEIQNSIKQGSLSRENALKIYKGSATYFQTCVKMARFPGCNLIKSLRLAITGLHFNKIAQGILSDESMSQELI